MVIQRASSESEPQRDIDPGNRGITTAMDVSIGEMVVFTIVELVVLLIKEVVGYDNFNGGFFFQWLIFILRKKHRIMVMFSH